MTFAIYNAEVLGNLLWEEGPRDITVNGGLFSVLLGEINPIPLEAFDGESVWMEVNVEGEAITPRKRMVSVGYAFRAEDTIKDWGKPGVAADLYEGQKTLTEKYVNADGDTMTGDFHVDAKVTTSGNIGIGTATPSAPLDVSGDAEITGMLTVGIPGSDRIELLQRTSNEMVIQARAAELFLNSVYNGISFQNSGITDMKLASDGNVGIGTTEPSAYLEVFKQGASGAPKS